jgi:hypothetical protein
MRCGNDDDASNECRVLSKNSNDSTARLALRDRIVAGSRSGATHFSYVGRDAHFPITRIQSARRRDRCGDGTMNGKRLKFFICNPNSA